ncbi:hypothetical protein ES705_10777 [subsurface metagenome]
MEEKTGIGIIGNEEAKEEGSGVNQQQLVVFKLGGEDFGVDIMQVREIIRKGDMTAVPNAPVR